MTKRDLAIRIAHQTNQNQNDVQTVLQLLLDTITSEVAAGRSVEFRNFGVFQPVVRRARLGRNPKSPTATVTIPEHVSVTFKVGKVMAAKITKINPKKLQ